MDPDENLRELLELANRVFDGLDNGPDKGRFAELVIALDEWIRKGGALPGVWSRAGRFYAPRVYGAQSVEFSETGDGQTEEERKELADALTDGRDARDIVGGEKPQ